MASARSIKSGPLGSGMFNLNVKWYQASKDTSSGLHQHHAGACLGAVGYRNYCKKCNQLVENRDIVKGATLTDADGSEKVIQITPDEIKELDEEQATTELLEFVKGGEIDPMFYSGTYYLLPDKGSENPYETLLQELGTTDRAGIVKYALRQRTRYGVLRVVNRPDGDVLAVHQLLTEDEVRDTAELPARKRGQPKPHEIEMARMFIDGYTETWDPAKYCGDSFRDRLDALIESKKDGTEFKPVKRAEADAPSDMVAQMKAQLAARRAAKAAESGEASGGKPPAKKRPTAKATAA